MSDVENEKRKHDNRRFLRWEVLLSVLICVVIGGIFLFAGFHTSSPKRMLPIEHRPAAVQEHIDGAAADTVSEALE